MSCINLATGLPFAPSWPRIRQNHPSPYITLGESKVLSEAASPQTFGRARGLVLGARGIACGAKSETIPYPLVSYVYLTNRAYFVTPCEKRPTLNWSFTTGPLTSPHCVFGSWAEMYGMTPYAGDCIFVTNGGGNQNSGFTAKLSKNTISLIDDYLTVNTNSVQLSQGSYSGSGLIHIGQMDNNTVLNVQTYYYGCTMDDGVGNSIDCVPVKLDDGTGGLWDKVSKSLLEKSSVGTFTAGPLLTT